MKQSKKILRSFPELSLLRAVALTAAMLLYRPLAQPDQYVDIGMGVRAWGIAGNITLNQGLLSAETVSNGLSWADPLIGARYHHDLGNGFSATAYGDVGGFGLGAHADWQIVGTIDYALISWIGCAEVFAA